MRITGRGPSPVGDIRWLNPRLNGRRRAGRSKNFAGSWGWLITFYAGAPYDFTNHMHTVLYHARRLEAALLKEERDSQ